MSCCGPKVEQETTCCAPKVEQSCCASQPEVSKSDTLELVKDYYGKVLNTTKDLKTSGVLMRSYGVLKSDGEVIGTCPL